jgi:hypothetical protein
VNHDFDFARKSTPTPRNPAKSSAGFRLLVPIAQGSSGFFTVDNFAPSLSLTTHGNRQSIAMRPQGTEVTGVSITLNRQ